MNTHIERDVIRINLSGPQKRKLLATMAKLEALTGSDKRLSMPVALRCGIDALAEAVNAAVKEAGKAKDGELGTKVWKLRSWHRDAAHTMGA